MKDSETILSKSVEFYKNYNYFSVSDQGKIRSENQDAVGIFPTEFGLLVVICDGLGGGFSGEIASRSSVDTIHKTFIESKETDLLGRIRNSIEKANKFVYEKSTGNLNFKGMATTCEVLLVNGVSAYWGHIGDSRIYLFKNKKVKQLTKDHSLIQKMLDEGVLDIKDYKNHPKKSVITKAIGDEKMPDIDTSKIILPNTSNFKFLICTDGVTCVTNDSTLEDFLSYDDIKESSAQLKNYIDGLGAPDNYSFVIVSR